MRCRPVIALLSFALLVLAAPGGLRRAWAETVYYGASPIAGYGYVVSYPQNQITSFTTTDASVSVEYDTYAPWLGVIDVSIGYPGYDVYADQEFAFSGSGDEMTFSAMYGNGGFVYATFHGDGSADVSVFPSYHGLEMTFFGSSYTVPEPSGAGLLAAGIGLAGLLRRAIRRPRA